MIIAIGNALRRASEIPENGRQNAKGDAVNDLSAFCNSEEFT